MSNPAAARLVNVSKTYGQLRAVHDLTLDIPQGSIFGLIGPNGAGKTTSFLMLATLLAPTSGRVEVAGADPATHPGPARRQVGYMPDVMGVYDNLRVDEYLHFFAQAYHVPRRSWPALVDGLLELVELEVKKTAFVDSLSRGMKQRLSLARALVHEPELLVLDEPASGLDPRARVELRNLIVNLRSMGKTIVISSHILAELEEMCTHVAIMEAGEVLAVGEPRDLQRQLEGGRRVEVRLAGGETLAYTVHDDDEQAALLQRLITEDGLPVVEFVERGRDLEGVFMEVTKGIVQ